MLQRCGCGFGYVAFSSIFAQVAQSWAAKNPLARKDAHFAPRAQRIIFLFMPGGPSHVDTFDHKPALTRDAGKTLPAGFAKGFNDPMARLMPSPFAFTKSGQSGLEISDIFPEIAKCADDICLIRGMHTNGQDHTQAIMKLHTGSDNQTRPSVGSWILYGLGSASENLPGYITITPNMVAGGAQIYGSAFLPAVYQGTPIIGQAGGALTQAQIRHIKNADVSREIQRQQLDFVQDLNREHLARSGGDDQIEGVIESYELAFRMQTEAPEVMDLAQESKETLEMYGVDRARTDNFARQCLLARRFVEKGVRFVQLNHGFQWDSHQNLKTQHANNALEIDQPIAALLRDLKARGLLKDTLVVWGGEFGRTPAGQGGADGRDHNPNGFTIWMAGGGVKGGLSYGETDEYGFQAVTNKVHMHDLHATVLHLLGLNHEKLTFRYAGRDFRLTDVHGNVVKAILS